MRILADEAEVGRLIDGLAESIRADVAHVGGPTRWAMVGIRSRGDVLARRLYDQLGPGVFEDRVGSLDITLYRDDLSEVGPHPVVRTTEVPFGIDGVNVILVDDVLMTGRSIRAALQSLMDLGRPKRVWLSVLVDRGGRELPIAADHAALDLSEMRLDPGDRVDVCLKPTDDRDAVVIRPADRSDSGH